MFYFLQKLSEIRKTISAFVYCLFRKIYYSKLVIRPRLLFGETVLITGGASGIGKLLAQKLAEEHHCRIVIWDIDYEKAIETCNSIQSNFISAYKVDISDRNEVYETAKRLQQDIGNITILVNNAATVPAQTFLDFKGSDQNCVKTMEVNALGPMWTCKAFLPSMIQQNRGHIVTIGSAAGLVGAKGIAEYCASKFACIGFHEAVSSEIYALGLQEKVRTTLINPYYINTGMFHGIKTKNEFLLPVLNPEYVTDEIITAILYNREVVNIPSMINLIPLFKLFPPSVYYPIMDYFGIQDSMNTFQKIRKY